MHAPAAPVEIPESTTPWPPRYRWLKRSLLIFLTVVVLLIGVHLWWNWMADRRLAAQIAAIHARGEPILPEDFHLVDVPDSQNAAWYLRQAAAGIKHGPEIETLWYDWNTAYTGHEISDLNRWVDDEQVARSMARSARALPMVAWNVKVASPAWAPNPDLNAQRELAMTLRTAAFVEHRRGNDAQAVEIVRDLHFVADAMQQYYPSIISHLVSIGLDAFASETILSLAPELAIADESAATRPSTSPATRAQVRQLIAELSDERQYRLGGIRSMYGERRFALDGLKAPQLGLPNGPIWAPAFKLDVINILKAETQVSQALGQPTLASARALMPSMPTGTGVSRLTNLLSSILMPPLNRVVETHFRGLTDRRAAVIALAIRLWRVDHDGKWPTSLAELAPDDLPAVPVDPFSPTAQPFHYKPDAPGGAIIYSVGDSGVDHDGSEQPLSSVPKGQTPGQWNMLNVVYHLTPRPATTRPVSQ
jgi:hypothetical protein